MASVQPKKVVLGESEAEQSANSGYSQTAISNRTLHWETITVTNLGIDLGLLSNSLLFTLDVYRKTTDGILRKMVLPPSVGLSAPNVNYAQVLNSGADLEVSYRSSIRDFHYNIAANVSYLHNELLKLSSGVTHETISAPYGGTYINRVGEPLSAMYEYRTEVVITTKEEAQKMKAMGQGNAKIGRLRYADANGDGKISGDDREILGSYIPKWTCGLSLGAELKGFDAGMVFSAVLDRQQFSPMSFQNRFPNRNQTRKWFDNRWTLGSDPQGKYPAMIQGESYEEMTDLMVSNTSFMKMKSLTLGYTHRFDKFIGRVFLSGENLFTLTHKDFDGFDPENGVSPGHFTNWGGDYPTARIYLMGINLTF